MVTRATVIRVAAFAAVGILAAWVGLLSDAGRAAPAPLFEQADGQIPPVPASGDRSVLRARHTTIAFDVLPGPADRLPMRQPAVPLELFPDVTVFAEFQRFDPTPSGTTWVGRVEGVPMSTVTLAYGEGLLAGSIIMQDRVFRISPAPPEIRATAGGRALHVVEQIDQAAFPPEANPVVPELPPMDAAALAAVPMADTDGFIDVMVVYTAMAQAWAGGPAGMTNLINLGVSETNTSYANSGVHPRIRLVHTALVPYTETSSFGQSLSDLRLGNGTLAGVHALRDAHAADLVMLLVQPTSPDFCGIAYLMTNVAPSFAPFGFSVTGASCVSPNLTFAHELGHNQGARHDWFMDSSVTPFSYAHGYVNPGVGARFRTIMAYPNHCAALGVACTRLVGWANPELRFQTPCDSRFNCALLQYWYYPGVPMGVPGGTRTNCPTNNPTNTQCDADDRRTLNETALTVANFRPSIQGTDR